MHMGQSPVQTVPVCPIQIRAHHHMDVFTDINEKIWYTYLGARMECLL